MPTLLERAPMLSLYQQDPHSAGGPGQQPADTHAHRPEQRHAHPQGPQPEPVPIASAPHLVPEAGHQSPATSPTHENDGATTSTAGNGHNNHEAVREEGQAQPDFFAQLMSVTVPTDVENGNTEFSRTRVTGPKGGDIAPSIIQPVIAGLELGNKASPLRAGGLAAGLTAAWESAKWLGYSIAGKPYPSSRQTAETIQKSQGFFGRIRNFFNIFTRKTAENGMKSVAKVKELLSFAGNPESLKITAKGALERLYANARYALSFAKEVKAFLPYGSEISPNAQRNIAELEAAGHLSGPIYQQLTTGMDKYGKAILEEKTVNRMKWMDRWNHLKGIVRKSLSSIPITAAIVAAPSLIKGAIEHVSGWLGDPATQRSINLKKIWLRNFFHRDNTFWTPINEAWAWLVGKLGWGVGAVQAAVGL